MREGNREIKKGKIAIVAGIIVLVAILVIVNIVKKVDDQGGKQTGEEKEDMVYELPDITYSDMKVTDIEMEYLANNNETMITFLINNTTENSVQNESLTAYLIDANEETIGQMKTYIASLAPGEQYSISVVMKGNLTATTQIKLQKNETQSTSATPATQPTNTAETNTTVEDDETTNTTTAENTTN